MLCSISMYENISESRPLSPLQDRTPLSPLPDPPQDDLRSMLETIIEDLDLVQQEHSNENLLQAING